MSELAQGWVVMLRPGHKWAGCLCVVDEVRSWGVTANIFCPIGPGEDGKGRVGVVPVRIATEEFAVIGGPCPFFLAMQYFENPPTGAH